MRRISDFCPYKDSKVCSGNCSVSYADMIPMRCHHLVEAELNQKHYSKDGTLPFWGYLTVVGKEMKNETA